MSTVTGYLMGCHEKNDHMWIRVDLGSFTITVNGKDVTEQIHATYFFNDEESFKALKQDAEAMKAANVTARIRISGVARKMEVEDDGSAKRNKKKALEAKLVQSGSRGVKITFLKHRERRETYQTPKWINKYKGDEEML